MVDKVVLPLHVSKSIALMEFSISRHKIAILVLYILLLAIQAVWMRFFPAIAELRKQIREGVIGDVMYVSANIGARRLNVSRLYDPKMGGGSVLDMGIYPINFATMIFGGEKPESIQAAGWLASTGACVARYMVLFVFNFSLWLISLFQSPLQGMVTAMLDSRIHKFHVSMEKTAMKLPTSCLQSVLQLKICLNCLHASNKAGH